MAYLFPVADPSMHELIAEVQSVQSRTEVSIPIEYFAKILSDLAEISDRVKRGGQKYMTSEQVSEYVNDGKGREIYYTQIRPNVRPVALGTALRYDRDDIDAFMKSRKKSPPKKREYRMARKGKNTVVA